MTISETLEKLTPAQREIIATAEPYGDFHLIRWPDGRADEAIRKRGLSLYWNAKHDSLTRLGEQVRAALTQQEQTHG